MINISEKKTPRILQSKTVVAFFAHKFIELSVFMLLFSRLRTERMGLTLTTSNSAHALTF